MVKMNKNISTLSLATTISSAFVGAGFVSGQELWQFFGVFGKTGLFYLVTALVILGTLCITFMHYCKSSKCYHLDTAVFGSAPKLVNVTFCTSEILIYFFLCVIMTSGFIALMDSFVSANLARVFGGIFILLLGIELFFGLKGLIALSSVFVPLLVLVTVVISAITLFKNGITIPPSTTNTEAASPLLTIPVLACSLSVSYNFFGSVGIMAPLTESAKSKKQLSVASILATLFLVLIGISILLSIFAMGVQNEALPMLEISKDISFALAIIYAALLGLAMFSCGFSSSVCIVLFAEKRLLRKKWKKVVFITLYLGIVYLVSMVGFSDLISTVYPIFGYIGFVLIGAVIYNAVSHRRKQNV